jgi:hypothetical protein
MSWRLVAPESIGIDDGNRRRNPGCVSDERDRAERFAALFRAVYLTFHRRDGPRGQLPASRAVLEHLAGRAADYRQAATHRRSVAVSEIVSHLTDQGLLERESDPADRKAR